MTMAEGIAAQQGDTPRWFEYVRVDDLVARLDTRNPKAHDIDELRASLGRFGYTAPIEVDERTGLLVSGHGRTELLALEHAAGDVDLPEGLIVDADGMWRAPVVRGWSSANDDEARAYLVAANSLVQTGGWHDALLVDALNAANLTEHRLAGTGYNDDGLTALAANLTVPDFVPSSDEQPRLDARNPIVCPACQHHFFRS